MRIAIVCEPDFFSRHVGVRALFSTLAKAAEGTGAEVTYLVRETDARGENWTVVTLDDASVASNFALRDEVVSGSPQEVYYKLVHDWFDVREQAFPAQYPAAHLALGSRVPEGIFDLAIYTAPWMAGLHDRFPARKVVALVYDTIPNSYALNGKIAGAFPHEHLRGFRFFAQACDEVWAISDYTRRCYLQLCAISNIAAPVVKVVPPALPYHLIDAAPAAGPRADTVVAVGLFDWRKGLADAPAILNATTHPFDLVVVGGVRVQPEAVSAFFEGIEVERVTWYRSVRGGTLADIYARARVLLFNSDLEGLGLPVVEAQSFGCRALASDVASIPEVLLPGSLGLPRTEPRRFAAELERMLSEPFDHDDLARRAQDAFALRHSTAFVAAALPEEKA